MFRKLLTFEEAKQAIEHQFKPADLGEEETVLLEAYNRVLAEDINSEVDIPPFNRSTRDGYAVHAQDIAGADENEPATLRVVGAVGIGEQTQLNIAKGEAAEIVTGAVMPQGADAVVMVEDTEREDSQLNVYSAVSANENVMQKATDIEAGAVVLHRGQLLGPSEIGVLAALGKTTVKVQKIPIIAVLSTGNEVAELGKPLPPGKIYDINSYSLCSAIMECGAKPVYFGVTPDDKTTLTKTLQTALASADMVITSGGVSVGPKDYTAEIVDSLGKPGVIFSGVAIKPGKPITVAFVGEKPVFSLPGHPSAALLTFYLFARSLVLRLAGRPTAPMKTVKAFAGARLFSAKGRLTFISVKLMFDENCRLIAEPVEPNASGAISTLTKADGFVEIEENTQFVNADEEVSVMLFRGLASKA
ncbi:MAG: molybdopterin molybdotransferase MoeA [Candidatus Bathyarchaeota archaeon]|nr:molybdopterin molybdotransferase MoeA [Candidatus Bathyarchaeota archaeon]